MARFVPLALLAVGLAGCGSSTATITTPVTPARTFAGGEISPPRIAPPIRLHDAAGRTVTLAAERGRYVLVTFLYTHCPDVCPLIAQNLNAAVKSLGPAARRVRVLAVSVDPTGDTPAAVRSFTSRLRLVPQFRYLIGTRDELQRTWSAWHVLSVRRSANVVDHIAYTALIDRTGKERVLYGANVHAREVVHDLRVLMHRSAATT
jgi:protein SCO1